jgi:hypothetical protein
MIDSVKDALALLNSTPASAPASRFGVIQRLISRTQAAPETDAAIVALSKQRPQVVEPQVYSNPRRPVRNEAQPVRNADVAAAQVKPARVENEVDPIEGFGPGKAIYGQWGNGKLSTRGGMSGSYEALPGYGKIKFELGGYTGLLTNVKEGVAWNPETQSLFHFKHRVDDGKFVIGRFQEFESSELKNKPVSFSGEMNGNTIKLEGGLTLTVNKDGTVTAEGEAPAELKEGQKYFPDHESYHDGKLKGQGFMDKNGNLVLAFDNGGTIQAAYSLKDGKFAIHGYKNI